MRTYLLIFPVALLVAYSQVVVKWRTAENVLAVGRDAGVLAQLLNFFSDPIILSAYAAALLGSFAWLFVVTKLPLTVAFPAYIGITFCMVLFGGWFFLSETLPPTKILAVLLIFSGIALGMRG